MQDKITMNGIEIYQPDKGLSFSTEPQYSEDTGRDLQGNMHLTVIAVVYQMQYKATNVPINRAYEILNIIGYGTPFTLHFYHPVKGEWMDGLFYVGQTSNVIQTLKENGEKMDLSFNMTGVKPL